jgi:hypothetical protein
VRGHVANELGDEEGIAAACGVYALDQRARRWVIQSALENQLHCVSIHSCEANRPGAWLAQNLSERMARRELAVRPQYEQACAWELLHDEDQKPGGAPKLRE